MQNFKVGFNLESPVILNRFSTFDSIVMGTLLWGIRKNMFKTGILKDIADKIRLLDNFNDSFIDLKELFPVLKNYIEIKNDVISGSTWFVEKDANVLIDNVVLIKKHEPEKIAEITGNASISVFNGGGGTFRAYRFKYETMSVDGVYFYVRADKEFIYEICKYIRFIGKKTGLYFGKVSGFEITETLTDKSFFLDGTTPARPLPCGGFQVDSNRIAFWRAYPPYSDKKNKVACYMPNSTLYETEYKKPEGYNSIISDYISPSYFAVHMDVQEPSDGKHDCILCGQKTVNAGNYKKIIGQGGHFNDYPFVSQGTSVCDDCVKTQTNRYTQGEFSNVFIYNGGYKYFMGGKLKNSLTDKSKTESEIRTDMLLNVGNYPLPYMFAVRSIKNQQHTVFKTEVAISNEMITFQWGHKTLFIDMPLFKEAVKEFGELKAQGMSKININAISIEPGDNDHIFFKRENYSVLNGFYKKYPFAIRAMLNWISF